jgi:hypothetical protein
MNATNEKVDKIFNAIMDLKDDEPILHGLFLEGFSLSVELILELQKIGSREKIDVSKHLEIITNVLGISLQDLVAEVLKDMESPNGDPTKNPDQETLDFITSDLDDYEKFLAKNSSKESLDFLTKEI